MNSLIVDTRKLSLIGKRNEDAQRQFAAIKPTCAHTFIAIIEGKFPLAVKIDPDAAGELRPRIFRTRDRFSFRSHVDDYATSCSRTPWPASITNTSASKPVTL